MNVQTRAPRAVAPGRERYSYFVALSTRFMDNDLNSHMNNAAYYSFIDTAITLYLAHAVQRELVHDPYSYLVVENGCTYFSAIAFPDVVQCGVAVTEIGRSSMRLEVGIFRNDEPIASARGFFVQVCCDRSTQRPVPIPQSVRAALEAIRIAG
jgi:acyl-CoA thioester hydrolase